MIVLDEQIRGPSIAQPIAAWYVGQVVSITALRPHTIITDEAIPTLLRAVHQPTFVTINVADFWRIATSDLDYAIVCVELSTTRVLEIPERLRRLFRMPEFRSKNARMGKIIRLLPSHIEYYQADRRVRAIDWLVAR